MESTGVVTPNINQAKGLRILLILNGVVTFRDRLAYLQSQSAVARAVPDINSALSLISTMIPEVVFISWDLKKANVKKFYELLTKTHGFICVMFSEERSPLRVSSLMHSGLPNMLLPPVSGMAILQRAYSLVKYRDHFLKNYEQVNPLELPFRGKWEKVEAKIGQAPIWKLSSKSVDRDEEYYARATAQPEFDPTTKKWKNLAGEMAFKKRRSNNKPENASTQKENQNALSSMCDMPLERVIDRMGQDPTDLGSVDLAKPEIAKSLESNLIPAKTEISPSSKSPQTVMAKSVELAVEMSVERTSEVTKPIEHVSKATITLVKTGNFKGYILGANGSNTQDEELAAKVRTQLGSVLGASGEEVGGDVVIQKLEIDSVPFMLWAEQNSEFVVKSQHAADDVAFAYFASSTIMERPDGQSDVFSVDVEQYLVADQQIDFDIYLHLPKNKKFIQYIKKGAVFTQKLRDRLLAQGIKEVSVKNHEKENFDTYCVKNEINLSVAKFKSEPLKT